MKKIVTPGRLAFAVIASLVLAALALAETPTKPPPAPVAKPEARQLSTQVKTWTGDFDGMLERRTIRVLAPYSRSLYFNDKGRERGLTADNVRDFERWINKKYAKQLGKRPITVFIIPTTRDRLLPEVAQGRGDIAVGNLTITEERRKIVDFVSLPDQAVGERTGHHRPEIPGDRHGGRPGRQDGPRAQGVELSREPRGAERAVRERGQTRREDRPRARRAGGRGHDGDAQRRAP